MVSAADVWCEVKTGFMTTPSTTAPGNPAFSDGGAFARIFRTSAELSIRGELQCHLRIAKPDWFTAAEYKMKCLSTSGRESGDLAVFDTLSAPVPDVVIELKHHSSLQKIPITRRSPGRHPTYSMEDTCANEINRWSTSRMHPPVSVLHLSFFTEITHIKGIVPHWYPFIKTYSCSGSLPPLGKFIALTNNFRSSPLLAGHTIDTASLAQSIPLAPSCVVGGFLHIDTAYLAQSIPLAPSCVVDGFLHVIGVWR